jgi:hypothetical protein
MKAFLANTSWSAQLRDGMMVNQWTNASHYGHLPAGSDDHAFVMPFSIGGVIAQHRRLDGRRILSDVRLGALAAVVAARGPNCPLSFSPWPGVTYDEDVVLARGETADLSPIEWLLIRLAFRFSAPSRREAAPLTEEILGDAAADLLALMEGGRFEEFRSLLQETLDLHRLLYALAESPVEPGSEPFNYAALQMERSGSIAWEWARAYRDVVVRAGDHLQRDERFFESCAYIAPRVMRDARAVAPLEATRVLFQLPATLFRALMDGAARRHAEAAGTPIPRGSLFTPTGASAAGYRSVWLRFVGAWESLADVIGPNRDASWEDLQKAWPAVALHLHDTALRLAEAAKSGEQQAIGWSADMLLKWPHKILSGWNTGRSYALVQPLATSALLRHPWTEVEGLGLMRFEQPARVSEVFEAVVDNAWLDTQVVVSCSLIGLFGDAGLDGRIADGPAEAAGALFRNESFDPSAAFHPSEPQLTAISILHAVLRLVGASERFEDGYGREIGELADEIDRLEGPNYVSARIYSWSGEADVEGQDGLQVLLMAAAVPTPSPRRRGGIEVGEDLKALLLPPDDRRRRRVLQHLDAMRKAAARQTPKRAAEVIATLQRAPCTDAQAASRLAEVVRIIEACEAEIRKARDAAIAQAAIDPGRLAEVGNAASRNAFSKVEGAFPLRHFRSVAFTDRDLKLFSFRLADQKGRYTTPLMDERLGGDDDWWADEFQPFVGAAVFSEVVGAAWPVRRAPRSADSYWRTLKAAVAAVQAAGQAPLIVRASRGEPEWLGAWQYDLRGDHRPADMRIEQAEGRGDGYDFDLNGTPVYSSPWVGAATWVLGREVLDRLEFQRFADGQNTTVEFEPNSSDIWKGRVVVSLGLCVTLAEGQIWRIAHQPAKAAPGP